MSSPISGSVRNWEPGARNPRRTCRRCRGCSRPLRKLCQPTEIDPRGVDGKISAPTGGFEAGKAIEAFQRRFTSSFDGLIESQPATLGSPCWPRSMQPPLIPITLGNSPFPTVARVGGWEERPRGRRFPARRGCALRSMPSRKVWSPVIPTSDSMSSPSLPVMPHSAMRNGVPFMPRKI